MTSPSIASEKEYFACSQFHMAVPHYNNSVSQALIVRKRYVTDSLEGLHTMKVESFILRTDIFPKHVAAIKEKAMLIHHPD